jgi:PAS domain S-box-containing protein
VFDLRGHCRLANQAFCNQLGYSKGQLHTGEVRFDRLLAPSASAERLMEALTERERLHRWEVTLVDRAGRDLPVLFSARAMRFRGESSFQISLTDISRQKELERAFRRDHARMASLIEALTAGLFLVDSAGQIVEVNRALANLLALEAEAVVGRRYEHFFGRLLDQAVEPEVAGQALSGAATAVAERPVVELVLGEDKRCHLEIDFFPVWDESGAPFGWGGLVLDVTEVRNRLAWKLELLSILAHDIRTPLATLKGHATALLANYHLWDDEMNLEFLAAMDRTTDQLVRQVDRSLALSRVEAGRLGLRPEAVRPADLVRQAVERAAGSLGEMGIHLEVPEDLPLVRADPARVEEVLVNLLDNAARFNPPSSPLLVRAQGRAPMVAFSVIDSGPGVPEGMRRAIFDKYERGGAQGEGTGLGLFIARKIVEAHGGKIRVEAPGVGEGAVFTFTLPTVPAESKAEPGISDAAELTLEAPFRGARVLVVEDHPDTQALLRAVLSDEGYEVDIAADGPAAVEIFQTAPPDIVLLDWMLPGMNGLLVCRTLRRWSKVPILLITSKTSQSDLVAALDAGADDYVTKPFQAAELLARMRALLRRGGLWRGEEGRALMRAEGLTIDFDAREVSHQGRKVGLTPTEYELLARLARSRGQVLTHDQLVDHLWGEGSGRTKHDLFAHVSRLRKKIEVDPREPRFVTTRRGVGYVFPSG